MFYLESRSVFKADICDQVRVAISITLYPAAKPVYHMSLRQLIS
jgi:hypothetical protein